MWLVYINTSSRSYMDSFTTELAYILAYGLFIWENDYILMQ
jgi:hypothetical protein